MHAPMKSLSNEVTIREFSEGDETTFRSLNEEWITRYFRVEPKDEVSFADPQETILNRGGRILFAVKDGRPVGCCALLAMSPGNFEVGKMAVAESAQGCGIGRWLLETVI